VAGFTAGGGVDITAHLIGQVLSERLGQQFIIDDRPGAGSNIGTEAVVNAPPDGYTLLLYSTPNAVNATLVSKAQLQYLAVDRLQHTTFRPIARGALWLEPRLCLQRQGLPARSGSGGPWSRPTWSVYFLPCYFLCRRVPVLAGSESILARVPFWLLRAHRRCVFWVGRYPDSPRGF
jgi:hypothetical protein